MNSFEYSQKRNRWLKQYGYKICKECGTLELISNFPLTGNKRVASKCKPCYREYKNKYQLKRIDHVKNRENVRKYRAKNLEHSRALEKIQNKKRYHITGKLKQWREEQRNTLSDFHMKELLSKQLGLLHAEIPKEMMLAKRFTIYLKRLKDEKLSGKEIIEGVI